MRELQFLKERLKAALARPELPETGLKRLALLVLSLVAAKAVFRLALTGLVVAGLAAWFTSRYDADNPEALRKIEEARRAIDEAESRAEALQRNTDIARQEETILIAVKSIALAMVARNTEAAASPEENGFTVNLDELYPYGFRPHPDLVYDIELTRGANGNPSFIVTVSHREPGPRAFKWDMDNGVGPEPVETSASRPGPAASPRAIPPESIPLSGPNAKWAAAQAIQDKEFDIQYALWQVSIAQNKRWEATGTFAADYADLTSHYHHWKADSRLIYGDLKVSRTSDGQDYDFEVTVRHKDRGPRAFKYRHSLREIVPAD